MLRVLPAAAGAETLTLCSENQSGESYLGRWPDSQPAMGGERITRAHSFIRTPPAPPPSLMLTPARLSPLATNPGLHISKPQQQQRTATPVGCGCTAQISRQAKR